MVSERVPPPAGETGAPEIVAPETDDDIAACYEAMRGLRTGLADVSAFVAEVRAQAGHGYRLKALRRGGAVLAVAGYAYRRNFHRGQHLFIDDLSAHPNHRGEGWGGALLAALEDEAREAGCAFVVLDSGTQRVDAHRFYLARGYAIRAFHFEKDLAVGKGPMGPSPAR